MDKYRCLVWGAGQCFSKNINLIHYYESEGILDINGITDNFPIYSRVGAYTFIEKAAIKATDYDIVLIMADGEILRDIENEVLNLGFEYSKIVPYKVLYLYGFDVDKYVKLRENTPSIFSPSCWGGITYNSLGLQFKSPLINMSIEHDEFLELVNSLPEYMEYELIFDSWGWEDVLKREYPIMRCGDVRLHCNHYLTEEDARMAWERRKQRVNWDNIFVMDFEEDQVYMHRFKDIPYKNKVLFTTFYDMSECSMYCDWNAICTRVKSKQFGLFLNSVAQGKYLYYDILGLLSGDSMRHNVVYI